jgi:hypothetical protein
MRACAERVAPEIGVLAWIVDDTGVKKDGAHSPGVKRQWSGTLGKVDNCQITVSVHAAGTRGTLPLGRALYLPEEWCDDLPRRRKAKIPEPVVFQTKPQLAGSLAEQAGRLGDADRADPRRSGLLATTPPFVPVSPSSSSTTCSRSRRRLACLGRRRRSRYLCARASWGDRVPSHGPTASRSRRERSPSGCLPMPGRCCLAVQRQRARRRSPAASPSSVSSPPTPSCVIICPHATSG